MTDNSTVTRKSFFLSILFSLLLLVSSGMVAIYVMTDRSLEHSFMLLTTAKIIDEHFPEEIDWDEMLISAREAMFSNLDRYSSGL